MNPNKSIPYVSAMSNLRAPAKDEANKAFDLFEDMFEDKYPKAVNNLRQDREELMAFYDFPAQHWQSLGTTNPSESTFATIRHRTKRAKGCLTDKGMLPPDVRIVVAFNMCVAGATRK